MSFESLCIEPQEIITLFLETFPIKQINARFQKTYNNQLRLLFSQCFKNLEYKEKKNKKYEEMQVNWNFRAKIEVEKSEKAGYELFIEHVIDLIKKEKSNNHQWTFKYLDSTMFQIWQNIKVVEQQKRQTQVAQFMILFYLLHKLIFWEQSNLSSFTQIFDHLNPDQSVSIDIKKQNSNSRLNNSERLNNSNQSPILTDESQNQKLYQDSFSFYNEDGSNHPNLELSLNQVTQEQNSNNQIIVADQDPEFQDQPIEEIYFDSPFDEFSGILFPFQEKSFGLYEHYSNLNPSLDSLMIV